MSVAKGILDRLPANPVQIVPVTCATTGPLTVYVAGDTVAIPAKLMAGSTFSAGQTGLALWQPPLAPICFKIT